MLAKTLFKLSMSLKRFNIPTQRAAYHVTNIEQIKDANNSSRVKNFDEDKLLHELNSRFPSKILVSLEANRDVINGPHILAAFNSLVKSYKRNVRDYNNQQQISWNNLEFFKHICSIIETKMNCLTGSEAVELLNNFVKLKVSDSNSCLQTTIKYICDNLNSLSFADFSTLALIIRKMPQSPLIHELELSLKKKFIIKLAIDFNENDIACFESALSFISYHLKNYNLLEQIIQKLENYNDEIPLKSSILILESLCNMNSYPSGWLNILHRVEDTILSNVEYLNPHQINFILYIVSEKVRISKLNEFYNPKLIDELIKKIIVDDTGLNNALSALKCLMYLRHKSEKLLNYSFATYFEKVILAKEKIHQQLGKILILISASALASHKAIFWNEVEDFILKNKELLKYDIETLTILTLNLICLDTYHVYALSKIFNSNYDYSSKPFLHWTLGKIYQKLKINQNYDGPMPTEAQLRSLQILHKRNINLMKRRTHKLLCNLEEGMGGSIYVKSSLATKMFHLIEHVVVFQENGEPLPINTDANKSQTNDIEYLEDLEIPPESKIVLIMSMPEHWHFRNSNDLLSTYKVNVETLEAMSYKVVIVTEDKWLMVPKNERTSFLMNKIKESITT